MLRGCLIVFLSIGLGVAAVTLFFQFGVKDYYRNSGAPPIIPGFFLGGPVGLVAGLVLSLALQVRRAGKK
ncbi:MAG: hypothetical protein JSS72_05460 [Armatimonadetes bacterium]|nr:hypothetical protein [Armatimonadota bacterium]